MLAGMSEEHNFGTSSIIIECLKHVNGYRAILGVAL